jgi:AraC-like DNA-binding protein
MIHHRKCDTYEISSYTCPRLSAAFASAVNIPSFGEQTSDANYTYHNYFVTSCVHLIMAGEGEFTVDGVPRDTKAGDIIVFFPGQDVCYRSLSSLWHYFWLRLEGENAVDLILELGYSREKPLKNNGNLAGKLELFERLKQPVYQENISRFRALRIIADMLELMNADESAPEEELAVKVKRRIDNLEAGLPQINELAEYYKVSRATLFRAFKKKYGVSLKTHIDNHRMEYAVMLLKRSQISIANVASLCGYTTERYFCHAFANKYKLSPGAFRKRYAMPQAAMSLPSAKNIPI